MSDAPRPQPDEPLHDGGFSTLDFENEEDGRIIATLRVSAYGETRDDALRNVYRIALLDARHDDPPPASPPRLWELARQLEAVHVADKWLKEPSDGSAAEELAYPIIEELRNALYELMRTVAAGAPETPRETEYAGPSKGNAVIDEGANALEMKASAGETPAPGTGRREGADE